MKEIGKIVSVHGVDGDIVISHFITNRNAISNLTELMIEVWNDSFIPFFIKEIKSVSDDDMVIKFEEINSREEAKKFINKRVHVFEDKKIQTHSEIEWDYLVGYEVISQEDLQIGKIENVISNSMQILIEVLYKNQTIHLPLHENLILDINKNTQTLKLEIPEGLLEVWD